METRAIPAEHDSKSFPSLDDSPLWADDFQVPREPEAEASPPLVVIRAHYPRIARAIEALWGAPEMDEYFHKLVIDDRRDRAGFPKEVLAAILKLSADHVKRFKFDSRKSAADHWGVDRFQRYAHR